MAPEWVESFDTFYEDMGPCPEGLTLERIDVNGDYAPGNCEWATTVQQARNKTNTRLITHEGKTQCLSDWAIELNLEPNLIYARLKMGMSVARALSPESLRLQKKHGTVWMYEVDKCRCEPCKEAMRTKWRKRDVRRRSKLKLEYNL